MDWKRARYLRNGETEGNRVPLAIELAQLQEEGKDVTGLREKVEAIWQIPDILAREAACDAFLKETYALPVRADFPYTEPNDLDAIKSDWGDAADPAAAPLSNEAYREKLYGGILGRCCGCLLGKPVEQWSRERIDTFLRASGQYPLQYYFSELNANDFPDGYHGNYQKLAGFMVNDDDIEYVMLNLYALEHYGRGLTAEDIGYSWLEAQPIRWVMSAEKIAYRNMTLLRTPPLSGEYGNPYREWIGAQIRSDVWGYINPGKPTAAAEYAFKDAIVSHVKNGIYCTIFNAVLISLAFVYDDIPTLIDKARQFVPKRSRTWEAIEDCLAWRKQCADYQTALDKMYEKYGHYSFVHAINNLCVCLLSLLYCGMDFEKCIVDSVIAGIDTDCNGATVGSVLGVMLGAKALPEKWTAPLNDTYHTMVAGEGKLPISEIARRVAVFKA